MTKNNEEDNDELIIKKVLANKSKKELREMLANIIMWVGIPSEMISVRDEYDFGDDDKGEAEIYWSNTGESIFEEIDE